MFVVDPKSCKFRFSTMTDLDVQVPDSHPQYADKITFSKFRYKLLLTNYFLPERKCGGSDRARVGKAVGSWLRGSRDRHGKRLKRLREPSAAGAQPGTSAGDGPQLARIAPHVPSQSHPLARGRRCRQSCSQPAHRAANAMGKRSRRWSYPWTSGDPRKVVSGTPGIHV